MPLWVGAAGIWAILAFHIFIWWSGQAGPSPTDPVCFANEAGVTCTFVNLDSKPHSDCLRGVVSQKSGGDRVEAVPLCSGVVGPRETKTITVPWNTMTKPSDICFTETEFGSRLDWDKCTFDARAL